MCVKLYRIFDVACYAFQSSFILKVLKAVFLVLFLKSESAMKGELQLEPVGEANPSDADPLLGNQEQHDSLSTSSRSSEIQDEDVENGSIPCCRICLESDVEPGDLIFVTLL